MRDFRSIERCFIERNIPLAIGEVTFYRVTIISEFARWETLIAFILLFVLRRSFEEKLAMRITSVSERSFFFLIEKRIKIMKHSYLFERETGYLIRNISLIIYSLLTSSPFEYIKLLIEDRNYVSNLSSANFSLFFFSNN